jgi:hypothetical protein
LNFFSFGFDPCKALVTLCVCAPVCVRPGNRFDLSLSDSQVYCVFHGTGSVKTAAYLSRLVPMSNLFLSDIFPLIFFLIFLCCIPLTWGRQLINKMRNQLLIVDTRVGLSNITGKAICLLRSSS